MTTTAIKMTKTAAKPIATIILDYAKFCTGYSGWDQIAELGIKKLTDEVIAENLTSKSKAMKHFQARSAALTPPKAPKVISEETGRPVKTMRIGNRLVAVEVASDIARRAKRGRQTNLEGLALTKAVNANLERLAPKNLIGADTSLGVTVGQALDL